ncbi:aldehyde dehydrogenase family protein [Nocardia tengchongensis]
MIDETSLPADHFGVFNPADGRLVGTAAEESAAQVAAAAAGLRAAQPEWAASGPNERAKWLLALQDWVIDHRAELADIVQSESGKVRPEAELEPAAWIDVINYYARNAAKFLAEQHPAPHSPLGSVKRLRVGYRPYPLVGVITPWNYPMAMGALDIPAALLAGAAVLHKPSEVTPLSALALARGWAEIGAPPVFAVVTGAGAAGAAVVEAADYVQFTGSTRTGKAVAAHCVQTLKPYSLELGGKDPAIVLADADLDHAARGIAWGGLFNSGQTCVAIERVYVEAAVYDEFVAKLVAHVQDLRQGQDDRDYRFDIGAMATPAQRDLVARHVNSAIAAGARALTGGKPTGTGTFFEPTVLVDADQSMTVVAEETFGPVLPVIKVRDEDEAVALANDSVYGLSATVWTGDLAHGRRIAARLEAGAVNINDAIANLFSFALPMGGWKQSGIGTRFGGAAGLRKYCRPQAMTEPRLPIPALIWFPYSKITFRAVYTIMRVVGARGRRRFA